MAENHGEGEQSALKMEDDEDNIVMNRKEKRKAAKKLRRKQVRKTVALMVREEEARMNDPEELSRLKLIEEEEARFMERERKEFEEKERLWIEAMEIKRKAAEQEHETTKLVESGTEKLKNDDDLIEDNWEYVEEGPAEIIWQGNEIIVKKKSVKRQKLDGNQHSLKEDIDRPTSNPLPPQAESFYDSNSTVTAEQTYDDVAQRMPNFGTEQDKAHCPFHFKTGACRFGQRCSRLHLYPDKSCTLLMKNMYHGPGILWEQDEGLEFTDEEVEHSFEEFYEDVHTEFLKFGEIVNFKVCKNSSFHLRGNVYVHYKSVTSAMLAYHSINGRYFGGKQVKCEFVCVTRWRVAICGEYMKSRLKTCSRGSACNFIHCFQNPGGDYEWADWDKPPPKYWVEKMVALFGFSDQSYYDKQTNHSEKNSNSGRTCSDYRKSRCKSENLDFTGDNIEEQWKCRYMEGRNGTDEMGRHKERRILKEGNKPYKRRCNGDETGREREKMVCNREVKIMDATEVLELEDHWRISGKRASGSRGEWRDERRKDEKYYQNDGDVYDEVPTSLSRSSHERRKKHTKEKGDEFNNHPSSRAISSKDGRREDDDGSQSRESRKRSFWDEGDRHDGSSDGRKKSRTSRDLDKRNRRHSRYDEKMRKGSRGRSCSSGSDMTDN